MEQPEMLMSLSWMLRRGNMFLSMLDMLSRFWIRKRQRRPSTYGGRYWNWKNMIYRGVEERDGV